MRSWTASFGLPKSTSIVETLFERTLTHIQAFVTEESALIHVCHLARHNNHRVSRINTTRATSVFAAALTTYLTLAANPAQLPPSPMWIGTSPTLFLELLGSRSKTTSPLAVFYQSSL